ncbi:hypothetical protein [Kordiimonas sp. SCSIO 12610]|uniref:hypothetical protein n=1 Tax=Kordiimonas sp. SCSIO 12610 TaxID=2829597 RepID=UPI00210AF4E1|nr:hypothetical protein [Kordiimonas sp. SCSIO 12610]UTW55984.1 hypothetical protein KFF44_03575 [Kordiimonas sp. SCSIO 12610]
MALTQNQQTLYAEITRLVGEYFIKLAHDRNDQGRVWCGESPWEMSCFLLEDIDAIEYPDLENDHNTGVIVLSLDEMTSRALRLKNLRDIDYFFAIDCFFDFVDFYQTPITSRDTFIAPDTLLRVLDAFSLNGYCKKTQESQYCWNTKIDRYMWTSGARSLNYKYFTNPDQLRASVNDGLFSDLERENLSKAIEDHIHLVDNEKKLFASFVKKCVSSRPDDIDELIKKQFIENEKAPNKNLSFIKSLEQKREWAAKSTLMETMFRGEWLPKDGRENKDRRVWGYNPLDTAIVKSLTSEINWNVFSE